MTSFHLPNNLLVFMVYYFTEEYLVRLYINKVHGKVLLLQIKKTGSLTGYILICYIPIMGVTWWMIMR